MVKRVEDMKVDTGFLYRIEIESASSRTALAQSPRKSCAASLITLNSSKQLTEQ